MTQKANVVPGVGSSEMMEDSTPRVPRQLDPGWKLGPDHRVEERRIPCAAQLEPG